MATTLELCESIELRLQQVLDETDRLTQALDALGPSSSVGGRVPRREAVDTAAPLAARSTDGPPRRAVAVRPRPRPEGGVSGAAERVVLALRAELDAGLRTTAGA